MTFGRQVNDVVDPVFFKHAQHGVEVADIGFHKQIIGLVLNVAQVG
ncbi:hypothetical protein SDC9_152952 [bioreactor metagenome]|uniref:Uncharacterized protein n=1 Tax=bioreactor metagenome TaxID=1076179 RepID=A0A645EWX2_9ZZZZ